MDGAHVNVAEKLDLLLGTMDLEKMGMGNVDLSSMLPRDDTGCIDGTQTESSVTADCMASLCAELHLTDLLTSSGT